MDNQKLKDIFIFRGLPDEELSALAQRVIERRLAKGEILMRKGETGNSVFMIHEGSVKIVTDSSSLGGELMLNKCGPDEMVGEMALLDKAPRSASAIALEDSVVLELQMDDFWELLHQRPHLSLAMIQGFSARLRFATTYIEKIVEWSQKFAAGDYSFLDYTPTILRRSGTDEDKAITLLSAFFQMVKRVKEREDGLKQQLEKLAFEIDHAKRKKEVEAITSSEFYAQLKEQAKQLRSQRLKDDDPGEESK